MVEPLKTKRPIRKVLVLHLEAAEPSLIEKWCAEGKLPILNKLKRQGIYTRLFTPGYIDSGCVWPTFSTGTNPGKHGMGFYPRQLKDGTYNIIKKYATDLKGEHFWETLDRSGEKMLVMDMALTYPKKDLNGTVICNWGDEHASHKPSSHPPQLIHDILKEFGSNELNEWYQHRPETKEEWAALSETLLKAIELRGKVVKHLLQEREWDGAVLNFGEIHWAGHMAWHLHDKNHPEYDATVASYCGDIILKSYQALDASLENILEVIPKDTSIMIVSALGMGAQVGGEMLLNDILQQLGMTPDPQKYQNGWVIKIQEKLLPGKHGMSNAIQQMERVFSPKLMMRVKQFIPTKHWDKWTRRFLDLGNTRAASLAFQVPGDHSGLIRINLKNREPTGKVNKGKEYDDLCDFLKEALLELRDSKDGSPVVKEVIRIRDRISGDAVDEMPDLAVVWREKNLIFEIESPRIGKIVLKETHKRSGGHINNGFLIASGAPFYQGIELAIADLMDIAPTVLFLFDHPVPEYMDGKIISEAFN